MAIVQHTIDTPYMVGPVHFYTAEIDGNSILFDTGPPTKRARQYLRDNIDLENLRYVFITHCHIDHYGQTHWLEQESNARLLLPYRDGLKILSHEERLEDMYCLLEGLGFDGEFLEKLHDSLRDGRVFPPFPKRFDIVEDDLPGHLGLRYLSCAGHSQSDIVYYTEDWAVTGDVLLRGVFQSPLLDVDQETGERFNNYEAYCSTIVKLSSLRGKQICPAHRKKIDSVDEVIVFYIAKMLDRALQLKPYNCTDNVADIIGRMFEGSLTEAFHVYLKASEIVFMQDFLENPGLLKRSLVKTGLFDRVAEQYSKAAGS